MGEIEGTKYNQEKNDKKKLRHDNGLGER